MRSPSLRPYGTAVSKWPSGRSSRRFWSSSSAHPSGCSSPCHCRTILARFPFWNSSFTSPAISTSSSLWSWCLWRRSSRYINGMTYPRPRKSGCCCFGWLGIFWRRLRRMKSGGDWDDCVEWCWCWAGWPCWSTWRRPAWMMTQKWFVILFLRILSLTCHVWHSLKIFLLFQFSFLILLFLFSQFLFYCFNFPNFYFIVFIFLIFILIFQFS